MSFSRHNRYLSENSLFRIFWFFFIQFLSTKVLSQYAQNIDVYTMSSSQGFKLAKSLDPPGNFGVSVSTAGDLNGDGKDDVIIGATGDASGNGMIYVVYGSDTLISEVDPSLPGFSPTKGFKIYDSTAGSNDGLGQVSYAGDINGDGIDDIIVGANSKYFYQGGAFVIYGKDSMTDIDTGSLSFNPNQGFRIMNSVKVTSQVGCSVRNAGDVNGGWS